MATEPELTVLESAVLRLLLEGDEPVLEALRHQLSASTVSDRKFTGVGFFTSFLVPDALSIPWKKQIVLGDVNAGCEELEHGAGFALFIDNGRLNFLEGFTYVETWPENVTGWSVHYSTGARRDLDKLHRLLQG